MFKNCIKYTAINLTNRITMLMIFALAFFVRTYRLDTFPLNHDEATWIIPSIYNFDRFMGFPVGCFRGYIQPFFCSFVILTTKIFSSPIVVSRVPAIIIGLATIISIYYLAKQMYGKKAGLISSLLLGLLPWHVIQSRIGVTLISTPLFGCLIFLALFRAIAKESDFWFLLSFLLLGISSFYTYQVSLLFIPIFFVALWCLRKNLYWLRPKILILGILIFLIIPLPLIYLHIKGEIPSYMAKILGMYGIGRNYGGGIATFLFQAIVNLKNNLLATLNGIFFKKAHILHGQALHYPLLINSVSSFIVLSSVAISLYYRKVADKILLIWLGVGYLGVITGVKTHDARYYITIILPPLLIFIARFVSEIFNRLPAKISFKREALFFTGITLCIGLFTAQTWQLINYYYTAPFDLDECRFNSYGCKEAAQYLSQVSDIKDYRIITDSRMEPLHIYLNYYLLNTIAIDGSYGRLKRRIRKQKESAYYVIWAPESHPEEYRGGQFSWLWKHFKTRYPNATSIKTIYYPNGLAAIHIFKVRDDDIGGQI